MTELNLVLNNRNLQTKKRRITMNHEQAVAHMKSKLNK